MDFPQPVFPLTTTTGAESMRSMIWVSYLAMGSKAGDNCIAIIYSQNGSLHVQADHTLGLVQFDCWDLEGLLAHSFGVAHAVKGVGKADYVLFVVDFAENGLASLYSVGFGQLESRWF